MTVKEFMTKYKNECKSFYLIPNVVSNQTFREPNWKYGFDIMIIGNLPIEVRDKKVLKHFKEDDKIIIIWKNE